jgi:acyl-[acyl carrier protein]--UDP-N-acetylglucosamine O-acyltransferase
MSGAADLKDKLDVSAATNLKSTLEVGAAATLKSSLTVSGDTAIAGASSTGLTSRLVGRVEIGSALTVTDLGMYDGATRPERSNAKLGVAGSVWVDGALRVMDTCLLANKGTSQVDIGTTSISGTVPAERESSKLRVAGSAYVDGSLYTGINANIGGDLSVTGKATVSGVTNLKSRTDIGTVPQADVSGAMLAVYGSLDVTGTTLMRDKVHIGSALTTTQQGNTAVTGAALVVNGKAYVEDNLVVNKDLRVNNDSVFVDAVTISGITNIGSFITATPAKPAEGLTPATAATLTVTGSTTFSGVGQKTTVTTLFEVNGDSKFTGGVAVEEVFSVGKTGAGNARQSTFYGQIQVHDGDLVVNPGTDSANLKKLLARGAGSEVGYIRFGKHNDQASISSTLSNTTVNFIDNNVTTSGDFSGKDLKATGNVTAVGTGTFSNGCYSSNFYATSDARLKREVSTVSDALEKCSKLRGVTFKWVTGEDQREQLGLIAQETQQVYPSLVSEHEGYLRVDYPKLVGLLIEAVKELDERTRPVAAA